MTIRQRITMLVVLAFFALSIVGGFAVVQASRSARDVRGVTEGVVPSAIHSVALLGQLKDVQLATQEMVTTADMAVVEQGRAELAARMKTVEDALDRQLASADSEAQAGLVREAQAGLRNYFAAIADTIGLRLHGQKELAEANLAATVDQYLREQGGLMQALQVEKTRSKDAAIRALNDDLDRTRVLLSAITLAAMLGLGGVAVLLYRQILRPLGRMQAKMTGIAGNQDYTQRMVIEREDEIGKSMRAFNAMIERIERSDRLVRQKTAEIQSMLHTVPEGILMVEADGRIHPEHSDHLRAILGSDEVAGCGLMEAVFAASTLGADALSQVEAALGACLGEDEMNFGFNAHLLPRAIERRLPSGELRAIDLTWAPMADAQGTVQRVLLCLRDVTELRALAQTASAQQRQLALIGEILAVEPRRFDAFIAAAQTSVAENDTLLGELAQDGRRAGALDALMRNLHTLKGNARTLGLLRLAEVVHRAEDSHERLRREPAAVDAAMLAAELALVQAAVADYDTLSREQLGRRPPDAAADAVGLPAEQLRGLLQGLELADQDDPAALRTAVRHSVATLRRLGTVRIGQALEPVFASAAQLARELGREAPQLQLNDGGIAVREALAATLRDVFTHLVRNALDHGLEPAAERVAQGKGPQGSLQLEAGMVSGSLQLVLADDGRGLALERIRQRAVEAGLLEAGADVPAADLAQLIFRPGLSTAAGVTAISGRGVGMDAVRAFVERAGGRIALDLLDAPAGSAYRPFRTVLNFPAELALVPSDLVAEVQHG